MPLLRDRRVDPPREADEDGVVRLGHEARVADIDAQDLVALEQALGRQEPDRELLLVARRPHRDRDVHGGLARAGGADLQRLLADDQVVPRAPARARGRPRPSCS